MLHRKAHVTALCAALAAAAPSFPAYADEPPHPVVVTNPVTLNPATPNPVTIVNPPNARSTVTVGNPAEIAKAQGIQHPYARHRADAVDADRK